MDIIKPDELENSRRHLQHELRSNPQGQGWMRLTARRFACRCK